MRPGLANVPYDLILNSSAVRNPNGLVNGAKFMAVLTNATESEVRWIWTRLKQLMGELAMPREKAIEIVKEEAKAHPWKH